MGYAAKGEGTPDVAYYLFDKNGKKLEECWFKAPYVGVMHDIAATDKWIIFTLNPLANVPEDLLKAGHKVYGWDETKSLCLGILPRRNPKPEMVKWFEYKNAFLGHTSNAFDGEDGCVYFDAPVTNYNLVRLNFSSVALFFEKIYVWNHTWQHLSNLSSWRGTNALLTTVLVLPPDWPGHGVC